MKFSAILHRVRCTKCSTPLQDKAERHTDEERAMRCHNCGHRFTVCESVEKSLQQGAYDSKIEDAVAHKLEVALKL